MTRVQGELRIASASFVGLAMTVGGYVTARPWAFGKAEAVFDPMTRVQGELRIASPEAGSQ